MNKKLLASVLVLTMTISVFAATTVSAQAPDVVWSTFYDAGVTTTGYRSIITDGGQVATVGRSATGSPYIQLVDAATGARLNSMTYPNIPGVQTFFDLAQDGQWFVVCGQGYAAGGSVVAKVRADLSSNAAQWAIQPVGANFYKVGVNADGNYVVVGSLFGDAAFWILNSNNGAVMSQVTYPTTDFATDFLPISTGYLVLTNDIAPGPNFVRLLRTDVNGNEILPRQAGQSFQMGQGTAMDWDQVNNVVICGYGQTGVPGNVAKFSLTLLTNADQTDGLVWLRTYGGTTRFFDVKKDTDNGFVIAGRNFLGAPSQGVVQKIDLDGLPAWLKVIDGISSGIFPNTLYAIHVMGGNGYIASGTSAASTTTAAVWNIRLAEGAPTTCLQVTAVSPANAATNVDVNANVVITFNRDVVLANPGLISVTYYDAINDVTVVVPVVTSVSGNNVTINPSLPLLYNTLYAVTVPVGSVTDQTGMALCANFQSQFTTMKQTLKSEVQWAGVGAMHAVGEKWIVWTMDNGGNGDAWAAPFSNLYAANTAKVGWVKADWFANGGEAQPAAAYKSLGWGAVPRSDGVNNGVCTFYAPVLTSAHWAVSQGYAYDVFAGTFSALPTRVDTLPA